MAGFGLLGIVLPRHMDGAIRDGDLDFRNVLLRKFSLRPLYRHHRGSDVYFYSLRYLDRPYSDSRH